MALSMDTKTQGTALTKMLGLVDLTPETLAKTFKDVGESPEKLRALLNLWFTPRFKPTFMPPMDHAVAGLRDVEFLATAELPRGQRPYRMFDIETRNLVEYPSIGLRGQYCMLSHRWKGVELSLGYIKEARKKGLERSREAVKNGEAARDSGKKSDVQLVLEQCRLDIEEQELLIQELCRGDGLVGAETATEPEVKIGHLLNRRLKARMAEDNLWWAKDKEDEAKSKLRFAQMEQKMFGRIVDQMQDGVEEKMEEYLGGTIEKEKMPGFQAPHKNVGSEVVDKIQAQLGDAEASLRTAIAERQSMDGDIKFFQQHYHLRDALDEMVGRLQRWKSAIKLKRSIQEAADIFKTKLFQHREKSYLWTDTCCIDKANGGELSESLSLMGDWYADAEYTLVQLDTRFREADAVIDWHRFDSERSGEHRLADTESNLQDFGSIKGSGPEWSTRAWTLQELVMSKTTFYVDSNWNPLSRPAESLGHFYYLIPFISLYTSGDTRNIYSASSTAAVQGFWDSRSLEEVLESPDALHELKQLRENIKGRHPGSSEPQGTPANDDVAKVTIAQQLIVLLQALGVRIPDNLTTETARSEMAQEVYLASVDLTGARDKDSKKYDLYLRLKEKLPNPELKYLPDGLGEQEIQEEVAQQAINFILKCLVAETEQLILADRQYIAEFGQVEKLGSWQQGTSRTGFSAESVLELSGKRHATVATDRSYALMGILGVRFPTFSAEGYVKALARLLDEVVIARNDISVFNWTGMEMGSPTRGRSMYPSSHTAYGNQDDRGRRYNFLLSARVQDKMEDVVATYHSVIQTLRNAIDFLRDRERKNLPFNWIDRIIQLVLSSGFRELKPQHEGFGKIIGYIKEECRKEREKLARAKEAKKMADSQVSSPATDKGFSLLKRPTLPSVPSMSSPSMPSFSLSSKKSPPAKEEESPGTTTKTSGFGLGKSLKSSSFGFSKKSTQPATDKEPLVTVVPITSPQSPEPSDITPNPPPPYEEVETAAAEPSWQAINTEVMEYLSSPATQRINKPLPPDLQAITVESRGGERPNPGPHRHSSFEPQAHDTISPNPIIVNNSGIEGLFDIQRVIVTMIDAPKLRRQIARATSPHDKISGWCSVSTGFARVVTSFACERRILEQELDVIESVEAQVLQEQDKDKGEKRGDRLLKSLSVTKANAAKAVEKQLGTTTSAEEANPDTAQTTDQAPEPENNTNTNTDNTNTAEELLVSRMIAFIQEPHLELIAGEWVLARFSGVSGANWFLAHLELGPMPGQFYGHRIAAGAIDFRESTPEPGLVNAWQTYMDRKKRKMCYILRDYLQSRTMARDGEEKLRMGEDLARQGLDMAVKGLMSPGAETSVGAEVASGVGGEGAEKGPEESGDESDGEGGESVLDKVLGQGKLAAKALGEYTVLAVAEKLFEMRADHLDKTLATAVLKRTPKSLRTAVENMNDNKSFLPAMFHSSTRVHMF